MRLARSWIFGEWCARTKREARSPGSNTKRIAAMAEHQMRSIAEKARCEFRLDASYHSCIALALCPRRSRRLFVRVESAHRSAAFSASQWIMDELKRTVPIWKHPVFHRTRARTASCETLADSPADSAAARMNWANRLTVSRLVLTILFVAALNSDLGLWAHRSADPFCLAGVTDFFDGEIARRYGSVTNFGKLMDPLVDKIMMAAAFISLVPLKAIPAWAATTVVARDFLITGLRLMASARGQILPAERLGQHKTSWQIITVIFFLVLLSARELHYADERSGWWLRAWNEAGPLGLDHGGADRLLRTWLRLAPSRRHRAGSVSETRRKRRSSKRSSAELRPDRRAGA